MSRMIDTRGTVVAFAIVMLMLFGTLAVTDRVIIPALLGLPQGDAYRGGERIVQAALLTVSFIAGSLMGVLLMRLAARVLLVPARHDQWKRDRETRVARWPAPIRATLLFLDRLGAP